MNNPEAPNRVSMKFIRAFEGDLAAGEAPPIWLMRQAGRYLPEYKKVRAELGGFLDLCYTPEKACEVTLQPITRFDFDAAILFSDILIVPHALGQPVRFVEGEGPRLDPITSISELPGLRDDGEARLSKVYEAVALIRSRLSADKALIGFCGAPYTVATYMIAGRGSPDQAATRTFAFNHPEKFQALIDLLVLTSTDYLCGQIEAGVNTVQIFDSWSGPLPDDQFHRWVVQPTQKIVAGVRAHHPDIPIIGFPRGSAAHAATYLAATGVNALGCDTSMPLSLMASDLGHPDVVRQGNLDPLLLLSGGKALDARIRQICAAMRGRRFIFNLGHGILPPTPPEHVQRLVEVVREST
ncbi:MAG: uroporphyrinogen decarboxylase [Hyphomicrobiaceae bacterium]